jgi:PKHD-type hydroxylase
MDLYPLYGIDNTIDQTNYYSFDFAFNEQELEWISNLQKCYSFETASTFAGDTNEFRKSKIKWMHHDGQSAWVYDRIRDLSIEANNAIWKFNLHSIIDSIQYTEYYEGGGHYNWHTDIGPGSINHRKISITIQLSDPNEYEGGDLELWSGGDFKTMPKQKGAAVLFPSFLLHRVTPVTKGVRKSLVLWVGGSPYK